ncbi:uncharacterized protein [Pseudorasbora parva]|uniref:uncharacterized protein isoform X1 n=1 Tax=Pseudorasbora parva TaxID=51549 RepID=UPI00351E6107
MSLIIRCYGDGASQRCHWVISSVISHCAQTTVQEQPLKQRLKKKLQRFDDKREEWVCGHKKNHNVASIKDEAILMLEKLHAIGYKPVLLLGKETKKKEHKCEILTPHCTLSTYAQDYLQKIGSFYEYLCEGWTQNSSGNDDQLITLHLTPCNPLENTSNWEEVRAMQASSTEEQGQVKQASSTEASSTEGQGQVKQASSTEASSTEGQEQVKQASSTDGQGQVKQASSTEGQEQVKQASSTEGQEQVKQASSTEGQGQVKQASSTDGQGQVKQASSTEGQEQVKQASSTDGQEQVKQASSTEGQEQVKQASSTEGQEQVKQASSMEGQGSAWDTVKSRKKRKSEGPRNMPDKKKPQKNCSYHTRLEAFPIRSVVRERVRKGKGEILVDWQPCPVCGEEWAQSWQPKDFLQMNEN